ncbi:hypothetical protein DH2020_021510 [Rehmannia glutinosa]|uniref:Uncharacterized protein n=1 Tax=Rehmannia glutinosa TaxID=99300 RepID=A0ABR0WEY5_REHGL
MGRSDDSISRRRSKKNNRKLENKKERSAKVSSRVAAIIAAKKRRQTGKRRMCQGMCFTLPTPEDPFNEKQGKTEPTKKRKRNSKENKKLKDKSSHKLKKVKECENVENGKPALVSSISFMGPEIAINLGKPTCQVVKWDKSNNSWKELGSENNTECPSKFLIMCLNSIQNAMQNGGDLNSEGDKPLFANAWGIEFWNCYRTAKDVLETNGPDSTIEQIAWMASTAADTISMKEKEGLSLSGPFLLYLVPSQDKASKVRQVCKPLKTLGIHTVSLHSGASVEHQINGLVFCLDCAAFLDLFVRVTCDSLKSCEPEFLISTPERLLELLALKAVDISGVSLLISVLSCHLLHAVIVLDVLVLAINLLSMLFNRNPKVSTTLMMTVSAVSSSFCPLFVIDGLEGPFRGPYFDAIKSIRQFISGNLRTVVFCDYMNNSSIYVVQKLLGGTSLQTVQ